MENLPTYRLTQSGPEAQGILNQVNLNTVDIEQLKRLYQALNQSEPEIIEPTDTWPVANPSDTVIYRVIDRENTPPEYYSDYMWNGTSMVPMAQYDNAIDNEPTANSNNLVKSGGVYGFVLALGGAYDISAAHAVGGVLATYDDLEDALGTNGANVPSGVRKGGMSVKFVLSSDNKYMQFRYVGTSTANADFANVANWQGVDDEPTAGSGNLVKSGGVIKNILKRGITKLKCLYHTRPVDLQVGESYFNTTSNNIVTLVSESSVEASSPSTEAIYIIEGTYYSWDGTNFCHLYKEELLEKGNLQNALILPFIVNSSNVFSGDGPFASYLYKVNSYSGRTIEVIHSGIETRHFSFLKSYPVAENNPDFCDGYTSRLQDGTYEVPSDCNYIMVNYADSRGNSSVTVRLKESLEETIFNTSEDVENLNMQIEGIEIDLVDDIELLQVEEISLSNASPSYWRASKSRSVFLNVKQYVGCEVTFSYPEGSTIPRIAFLTSNVFGPKDAQVTTFCNGYSRPSFSGSYIIPDDCKYINIGLSPASNLNIVYPNVFTIKKLSLDEKLEKLYDDIVDRYGNEKNYYDIDLNSLTYSESMLAADAYVFDSQTYANRLLQFYSMYDSLQQTYPDYITKVNLDTLSGIGNTSYDSTEYPIYAYIFNMDNNMWSFRHKIRIMIVTGTHIEYVAMYCVYTMMKNICEKWGLYDALGQMRVNIEFVVIPCSSPWQIANNSIRNINGVNLNRNCGTTNWQRDDSIGTGVTADSEYETKVFEWAVLNYNPSAVFDMHNYTIDGQAELGMFTNPYSADNSVLSMLLSTAKNEEIRFRKEFPNDAPASIDRNMTNISLYGPNTPGRRCYWTYEHGIKVSANVEIRPGQIWHNGATNPSLSTYGEADAIKVGVDMYTNVMIRAIQKIVEYNL